MRHKNHQINDRIHRNENQGIKKYLFLCTLFFFCNICTKTTTIIVAFSTLFEPDEAQIEQHIRDKIGIMGGIRLFFSGIPSKEEGKRDYFELLNSINLPASAHTKSIKSALQSPYYPWEKEYAFPPILRYNVLTKTLAEERETYAYVSQKIESANHLSSGKRKINQGLIDFVFQSKRMNPILIPIKPMINLMRSLKKQGYQLILIANAPGYGWETFLRDYPQAQVLSELFQKENMFISGIDGVFAQSETMYTKIITQKNLTPNKCLVIDSNVNNVRYPRKIGMKTIIFNTLHYKFKSFNTAFQKLLTSEPKEKP